MPDITLRPMTIGEVLDRTFSLYKSNFWLFVGISALPFVLLLLLNVGMAAIGSAASTISEPANFVSPFSVAAIGGVIGGALVVGILFLALIGATQAATIFAVSDLYLGIPATVRGAYRRVGLKAFRVLLLLFVVGIVVGVGFLLLIVPGFILLCRTSVAVPVAMLENTKVIRSIERSMELTKGFAGQIFLILLLVWVINGVAGAIFQFPFLFIVTSAAIAHKKVSFAILVLQHLAEFVSQVLVGPIATIAFSLMYYNLRVRKEAFDIQHLMASMDANPVPSAPSAA